MRWDNKGFYEIDNLFVAVHVKSLTDDTTKSFLLYRFIAELIIQFFGDLKYTLYLKATFVDVGLPQRHRPHSHNLLCVRGDSNTTKHFLKDSIVVEASVLITCSVHSSGVPFANTSGVDRSVSDVPMIVSFILAIVEDDRPVSVMCFYLPYVPHAISANINLYKG